MGGKQEVEGNEKHIKLYGHLERARALANQLSGSSKGGVGRAGFSKFDPAETLDKAADIALKHCEEKDIPIEGKTPAQIKHSIRGTWPGILQDTADSVGASLSALQKHGITASSISKRIRARHKK